MPSFEALLACPRCSGALAKLRCERCGAGYDAPGGIPALRFEADARTERVRDFYAAAPFPGYGARDSLAALRARAARSELARRLDEAIPGDALVLEMGCGTGQLSLFLASANRTVIGADLTRASLELAAGAAERFGVRGARFVETDARAPGLQRAAFDVVICTGVLHHTPDPAASFAALSRLARPGGVVVVGLYHWLARLPLRLRRALWRLTGIVAGDPVLRSRDAARREAWLRDQYRHPEEHVHSLGEVRRWFARSGLRFLRTLPASGPSEGLFDEVADDFWPERAAVQAAWPWILGGEGGLFVAVAGVPGD